MNLCNKQIGTLKVSCKLEARHESGHHFTPDKCTCGVSKVGGNHSTWCDVYAVAKTPTNNGAHDWGDSYSTGVTPKCIMCGFELTSSDVPECPGVIP